MKRILLFTTMLFMALGIFAQRAAVMEFKAGVGISQADVDGLSGIFTTYFRPAGYTMIERTQIDRIIDEQQMQRHSLTESQMVRIGEILNLSKIVIGDINIVMGQYNVDVRVVNVESGTISATEGATFDGASYREGMKKLAQKLASQIAITAGPIISNTSSSTSLNNRKDVETLYGYLHIFPSELGIFQSQPNSIIENINNQCLYNYNDWRLPTSEELSLLHANGYLTNTKYMTKENGAGMVLLVTTGKPTKTYQIGDYYKDHNKEGIVVKVTEDGKNGLILSLYEMTSNDWTDIIYDGSLPTSRLDGETNTKLIKSRNNYQAEFPSVAWISNLGEEWYLPAIDEWVTIIREKDIINAALIKLSRTPISDANYISSHLKKGSNGTEYFHYYIEFNGSTFCGACNYKVRAIAKF